MIIKNKIYNYVKKNIQVIDQFGTTSTELKRLCLGALNFQN